METTRGQKIPVPLPFTGWQHFKEAFSADLVWRAIRTSDIEVRTCIDPFGGSGTTALTCQFAGVIPTTIEINPYLADLIEAKLQVYEVNQLVRDLGTVLRLADTIRPSIHVEALPPTFVEPGVKDRWLFDRPVAHRILALATACTQLASPNHRRLFRVLLAGTLVSLSNVTVNGKGRRYRGRWHDNSRTPSTVDRLFTTSVSSAIAEIRQCAPRPSPLYTVIRGDSRVAVEPLGAFDLAVFSPPYPNSFDYTDVYNIELWMLGYLDDRPANRSLRAKTLSSHVQISRVFSSAPQGSPQLDGTLASLEANVDRMWNRNIPQMVGSYFAEIVGIIHTLGAHIARGGKIWIVVGDSSYTGVPINVAPILAELVDQGDLAVERIDTLREMRRSAQQGGQNELAENLLVLRRN